VPAGNVVYFYVEKKSRLSSKGREEREGIMGRRPVPCYAPLATFGVNVPTLFLILFYLHHDVTTRLAIGIHSNMHALSFLFFLFSLLE